MRLAGIITARGIVRGSGPVAQVLDDRKRRAVLEARGNIVIALERKRVLGDDAAVTRAEAHFDRVHIECYGYLPRRSQPVALSPAKMHWRQLYSKVARETARAEALQARRPKKQISAGRITNSARSLKDPGSGDLEKLTDMLMGLRDNPGFGPIT